MRKRTHGSESSSVHEAGCVPDDSSARLTAEQLLGGSELALTALAWVRRVVAEEGVEDVGERVGRSQVAFHRRVGFAWLWRPGRYLRDPGAEVVLSLALGRHDPSPRWKEVAHPSARHWVHHLEVHAETDLDDEVAAWLREARDRAGPPG
jgi:hypothetical protein